MKIKIEDLITRRNKLTEGISNLTIILLNENVYKTNETQNHNIPNCYDLYLSDSKKLVKVKLLLQVANFGFSNLFNLPVNNNLKTIFKLSSLKERQTLLTNMIGHLNRVKLKKFEEVALQLDFLTSQLDSVTSEIENLNIKIKNFNEREVYDIL